MGIFARIQGPHWSMEKKTGEFQKKRSFFHFLRGKLHGFLCRMGCHDGPIVKTGYIKTGLKISKDIWDVRRCLWCNAQFCKSEDRHTRI